MPHPRDFFDAFVSKDRFEMGRTSQAHREVQVRGVEARRSTDEKEIGAGTTG